MSHTSRSQLPTPTKKPIIVRIRAIASSSSTANLSVRPISLPIKVEITLNCLVHGEHIDNGFIVKIKVDGSVQGLKEIIKNTNEPNFDAFAIRQLKIWIVDVPLESENLVDPNVDIATTLNGRKFILSNKVRDFFRMQPAEDHVQIIVQLPVTAASFGLSGTTDVVMAKKSNADCHTLASGIQVEFELKKKIQESHISQAIGQLFMANIRSNEAVFVVITDLDDEWIFFWLENRENGFKIMQFRADRHAAIIIIKHALELNEGSPLSYRRKFINFQEHVKIGDVDGVSNVASEEVPSEGSEGEIELYLSRPRV
ncbi:9615_t:CDS:2 [Funneliformis geosporum]|uniref:5188_t:CDS:1 n=1 Tax=Funneliformis geosporum TaxID=1117311 RepID=A0A9W4SJ17_9GLOM|nr:9615_t:CDS:2 [Funneliformis geosporum]CAI2170851.1 5188_t:CDS:2 [Funneliformis geosporum]